MAIFGLVTRFLVNRGLIWTVLTLLLNSACVFSIRFTFPVGYEGLWSGTPEFTAIGPFSTDDYVFSISQVSNGDYLMEVNIMIDGYLEGWQRFYVEGESDSPGRLW